MNTPVPPSIDGFWMHARRHPDAVALVDPDGRTRTYGETLARVDRLSNALRERGLDRGSVVAVAMVNCFEYYDVLLATAQIGVDLLTLGTHLTAVELEYILGDSGARLLIVDADLVPTCASAATAVGIESSQIITRGAVEGHGTLESLIDEGEPRTPTDRSAGVTLLYTSGTTGTPKGVRRLVTAHASPEDVYARHAALMVNRFDWVVGEGVYLLSGPLYHRASSTHSVHALMLGHTVVVVKKWEAELALELIERFAVTTTHMVPTMFHRLLMLPETVRSTYNLSTLRSVVHAAAPCPVHEKQQMIDWWGHIVYEYYAATEGGGTVVKPDDWLDHPGTVGRPWPGAVVEIRDESGHTRMPTDEIGTIWMSVAGQDFEYIKDPVKTAASRYNGMFTAGDMGRIDSDGWLFIADRRADLIISGGVNIYPAEIESVLLTHPDVDEVAVVGLPDPDWGQSVKAFVRLRPGIAADRTAEQRLRDHSAAKLARYKGPRAYEFVSVIPRSEIGKVLKNQLR